MIAEHEVHVDALGRATILERVECRCDPFACALVATAVAAFVDLPGTPLPVGVYRVRVGDDGNVERWARA